MEAQNRIVTKTHELFMLYGIRSVSMDEIANHLGMSKKTIYQYFKDKDALVDGVINIEIERHHEEFSRYAAISENAIHEMFLALDTAQEMFKHMNPSVMFDLQKYHSAGFEKFKAHKNTFFYEITKANIERGKQEGYYRIDLDADIMSKYRLESIMIPFNLAVFPPEQYTLVTTAKLISENFIYGLVTPQGHTLVEQYINERRK